MCVSCVYISVRTCVCVCVCVCVCLCMCVCVCVCMCVCWCCWCVGIFFTWNIPVHSKWMCFSIFPFCLCVSYAGLQRFVWTLSEAGIDGWIQTWTVLTGAGYKTRDGMQHLQNEVTGGICSPWKQTGSTAISIKFIFFVDEICKLYGMVYVYSLFLVVISECYGKNTVNGMVK